MVVNRGLDQLWVFIYLRGVRRHETFGGKVMAVEEMNDNKGAGEGGKQPKK